MTDPAPLPALVAPEDLASYMQRDLDRSTATLVLDGASDVVRHYCLWDVSPQQTVTWTLDGHGGTDLLLPTLHLVDVASVSLDGNVLTANPDGPGQPRTGYRWSAVGQLHRAAGWPHRMRCIQVTCTHGYATTPPAVGLVVLSLAARTMANPEALQAKTVGAVSRVFQRPMRGGSQNDLTDMEARMLDRYRLP